MKVQMQGQSLRLRVDEEELARLRAGGFVDNATVAGPDALMRQRLRVVPGDVATFEADALAWTFGLPAAALEDYVSRLPCRDALEFSLQADDTPLALSFEVDVRDSVRRRGPPPRRRDRG